MKPISIFILDHNPALRICRVMMIVALALLCIVQSSYAQEPKRMNVAPDIMIGYHNEILAAMPKKTSRSGEFVTVTSYDCFLWSFMNEGGILQPKRVSVGIGYYGVLALTNSHAITTADMGLRDSTYFIHTIWDISTEKKVTEFVMDSIPFGVCDGVAVNRQGTLSMSVLYKSVNSIIRDPRLYIHAIPSGNRVEIIDCSYIYENATDRLSSWCFSADSRYVYVGTENGKVYRHTLGAQTGPEQVTSFTDGVTELVPMNEDTILVVTNDFTRYTLWRWDVNKNTTDKIETAQRLYNVVAEDDGRLYSYAYISDDNGQPEYGVRRGIVDGSRSMVTVRTDTVALFHVWNKEGTKICAVEGTAWFTMRSAETGAVIAKTSAEINVNSINRAVVSRNSRYYVQQGYIAPSRQKVMTALPYHIYDMVEKTVHKVTVTPPILSWDAKYVRHTPDAVSILRVDSLVYDSTLKHFSGHIYIQSILDNSIKHRFAVTLPSNDRSLFRGNLWVRFSRDSRYMIVDWTGTKVVSYLWDLNNPSDTPITLSDTIVNSITKDTSICRPRRFEVFRGKEYIISAGRYEACYQYYEVETLNKVLWNAKDEVMLERTLRFSEPFVASTSDSLYFTGFIHDPWEVTDLNPATMVEDLPFYYVKKSVLTKEVRNQKLREAGFPTDKDYYRICGVLPDISGKTTYVWATTSGDLSSAPITIWRIPERSLFRAEGNDSMPSFELAAYNMFGAGAGGVEPLLDPLVGEYTQSRKLFTFLRYANVFMAFDFDKLTGAVTSVAEREDAQTSSELIVSPNPATDYLRLWLSTDEPHAVRVYSLLGECVINTTVQGSQQISTTHLPSGTYLVRVITATGVRQQTISILH